MSLLATKRTSVLRDAFTHSCITSTTLSLTPLRSSLINASVFLYSLVGLCSAAIGRRCHFRLLVIVGWDAISIDLCVARTTATERLFIGQLSCLFFEHLISLIATRQAESSRGVVLVGQDLTHDFID